VQQSARTVRRAPYAEQEAATWLRQLRCKQSALAASRQCQGTAARLKSYASTAALSWNCVPDPATAPKEAVASP
jgi:hypothetical protein